MNQFPDNNLLNSTPLMLVDEIDPSWGKMVSLLPSYNNLQQLLFAQGLPCHGAKVENKPIEFILKKIKRQTWTEGLYVLEKDLSKIPRYKNHQGQYKNDFDSIQFLEWVRSIEENTALCEMGNATLGMGVFVPPEKLLPRGTFIPSSGVIKLDPTIEEFGTKINCSALQNLDSLQKKIIGFIDPEKKGGILNFINHAPDKNELPNFLFKDSSIEDKVATSNLKSMIKFYDGYAIMGLEVVDDIAGGEFGTQLLWSYARSCEYIDKKRLLLFNKFAKYQGETLELSKYDLKIISIFIDTGDLQLKKVAAMTRWELMENSPQAGLFVKIPDPNGSAQAEQMQSVIPYKVIQTHLNNNPLADRVIIQEHRE